MSTDAEVLAALTDQQALAATMWGEARGIPRNDPDDNSPIEEMIAVGCVVRNRRIRFSRWRATDPSYRSLCLAPNQFSCWNQGTDVNHLAVMNLARQFVAFPGVPITDAIARECLFLAVGIINDVLVDRTGGSDSYYAPAAMVPVGRVPSWAMHVQGRSIGDQVFFRVA